MTCRNCEDYEMRGYRAGYKSGRYWGVNLGFVLGCGVALLMAILAKAASF